ncbi:hypothetical protein FACS1894125_6160 [Actinomycetota bacterium]|nr:hypothetical protein FACS1894125_6160 [Actinomycetota bacterium]
MWSKAKKAVFIAGVSALLLVVLIVVIVKTSTSINPHLLDDSEVAAQETTQSTGYDWLCNSSPGIVVGSTGLSVLEDLCHVTPRNYFSDRLSLYSAIKGGKVKYVITDELYAKKFVFTNPDVKIIVLNHDAKYNTNKQVALELDKTKAVSIFNFDHFLQTLHGSFVEDDHWLYFVLGLSTTLGITLWSFVLAILIGVALYFLSTSGRKLLKKFVKWYEAFFEGTPVLIVLMVIFYIVFRNVDIKPFWAAVLAFGLSEATGIFSSITSAVHKVGSEQEQVARAMGFSRNRAFRIIVLPQVLRTALEDLKSNFVSIFKDTSIVGFIAGFDLTHAVDLVREETYETILPLLFVAIIYFVCVYIFVKVFNYIFRITDPRRHK